MRFEPKKTSGFKFVIASMVWVTALLAPLSVSADEGMEELDLAALMELDNLVTSATKIAQSIAEAPAIISVISRRDIEARDYRSVAEALNSIPGIFVNYDYVLRDVGVRGVSGELRGGSRLIKVMINGNPISFRSETTNWMGPELIPIGAVERIEVIRGPGSALYGANAFLGVINIITKSAEDTDGTKFTVTRDSFNGNSGHSISAIGGYEVGPFEMMMSFQSVNYDRSGLRVNCGTTFASDVAEEGEELDDPCESHEGRARVDFNLDENGENYQQSTQASFDDFNRSSSFVGTLDFDVDGLFEDMDLPSLGHVSVLANMQRLDVGGSFADWGTLIYDYYDDEETQPVVGSGNRVALMNNILATKWERDFWDERITLTLGGRWSTGGASPDERLRDYRGIRERSRSGYEGRDFYAEVFVIPVKDVGEVSDMPLLGDVTILNNITLMVSGDKTEDRVDLVTDASGSQTYGRIEPTNQGYLAQVTGSLINKRLNFVVGYRKDDYEGAVLSEDVVSSLEDEQVARLCDGDGGKQVCYARENKRLGLTLVMLKDFIELGDDLNLVDELYVKYLQGTAFKAPSSLFLYHEGFLGATPVNPNQALLPQDVTSVEYLLGGTFMNGLLDMSVALFENTLENKAEFTKQGLGIVAGNASTVVSEGLEFQGKLTYDPVQIYFSYAKQSSAIQEEATEEEVSEEDKRISDTFGFPDTTMVVGVRATLEMLYLRANFEYRTVGQRVGFFLTRGGANQASEQYSLPAYSVMDIAISTLDLDLFETGPTRMVFSMKNLGNEGYDYPGFQPYYRVDTPGEPTRWMFSLSQQM